MKKNTISKSLHDTVKINDKYFDRGIVNGELKYFRILGQSNFVFSENFGSLDNGFLTSLKSVVPKGLSRTKNGIIDNSKLSFERYFELNHRVHKTI